MSRRNQRRHLIFYKYGALHYGIRILIDFRNDLSEVLQESIQCLSHITHFIFGGHINLFGQISPVCSQNRELILKFLQGFHNCAQKYAAHEDSDSNCDDGSNDQNIQRLQVLHVSFLTCILNIQIFIVHTILRIFCQRVIERFHVPHHQLDGTIRVQTTA